MFYVVSYLIVLLICIKTLKHSMDSKSSLHLLLVLVSSSLLLSVFSVRNLEWEDHVSIPIGTLLFFCGAVFFTSLYLLLKVVVFHTDVGKAYVKKYKLTKGDVLDINNKQVSAIQALFCCITGTTSCTFSCFRDILKTSHYISEAYAWFGAAYFFYDIWSMYNVYNENLLSKETKTDNKTIAKDISSTKKVLKYLKENAVIVGHHIFIGGFGFLVITYLRGGLGDCFFGFVYLMEASTPFVSLRGILSKLGLKDSKIYVVNGLVMLGTFFVFRVIMFPCVIYLYGISAGLTYPAAIWSLPRGCKIGILILLLPQVYWFWIMLRGATKVLRKSKPKTCINGNYKKGVL